VMLTHQLYVLVLLIVHRAVLVQQVWMRCFSRRLQIILMLNILSRSQICSLTLSLSHTNEDPLHQTRIHSHQLILEASCSPVNLKEVYYIHIKHIFLRRLLQELLL
jgi:hypothetical protein